MGDTKISLNRTVIINVLSISLVQGISFITAPIFLRLLGPGQYGVFALFSSIVSIISCFMGFGSGGGLATSIYDFKDEYYEFRSSNLLLGTLFSAVFIFICVIFINPISDWFGFKPHVSVLIFLTAFSLFVFNFASSAFAYEKTPTKQLITALSISLLNVGITFFFIYLLNAEERYLARIYGFALAQISVAVALWFILFLKKPWRLDLKYNKYALQIGIPIIFHTLANTVLMQSNKVMMQHMGVPFTEIGIFTAYYSLASLLTVVLVALNTSWAPYYYDDLKAEKWDKLKIKTKRYLELFTVVTCGFLLLSREIALIFCGERYSSGINVLPILAISSFFIFMYQFPVNFEIYHKKTRIIAIGTISAAVANILFNFIGIRLWGMFGASFATVVSYIFLFIIHFTIVRNFKICPFHMVINDYVPWLLMTFSAFAFFYVLKDFYLIRWIVGIAIGAGELIRIKNRRSLF